MNTQRKMTAAEFLALPESNLPHQLINGEEIFYPDPPPSLDHQDVILQVAILLKQIVKGGNVRISPLDVHLDEANVVQPDVIWVAEGSTCIPIEGKHLRGVPDLVIEVLSPGTARFDRKEKFHLYEKHGVREYWIVDPAAKLVEVWYRADGKFTRLDIFVPGDQFSSPLLGTVEVKEIFPE